MTQVLTDNSGKLHLVLILKLGPYFYHVVSEGFDSTTASTSLLIGSVQVSFMTCKIPSTASTSKNLYILFGSHGMLRELRKTFMPVAPSIYRSFVKAINNKKIFDNCTESDKLNCKYGWSLNSVCFYNYVEMSSQVRKTSQLGSCERTKYNPLHSVQGVPTAQCHKDWEK